MRKTAKLLAVLVIPGLSGCTAPEASIALYEAIRTGQLDYVEEYLAAGGDANGVIDDTPMGAVAPLKVAVYSQNEQIVVALLRAGARKDVAGIDLSAFSAKGMDEALTALLADAAFSPDSEEVVKAIGNKVRLVTTTRPKCF